MQKLNQEKRKEMVKNGIIESHYYTPSTSPKSDIDITGDDKDIEVDMDNSFTIQLGYNYTTQTAMDIIATINNLDRNIHHHMRVSAQHLKDVLEMFCWDTSFSSIDTANLFNMLLMSASKENIKRPGGGDQSLKSSVSLRRTLRAGS